MVTHLLQKSPIDTLTNPQTASPDFSNGL